MKRKTPEIIEVTSEQVEELLQRAQSNALCDEDMELLRQIFESYAGFFKVVGDKNTTIARLRKMMFGATTEKSENVLGDAEQDPSDDLSNSSSHEASDGTSTANPDDPPPGHGRRLCGC
jgi:transposase